MNPNNDPSISDLFQLVIRHLPIALLVGVLAAAAMYFVSRNVEPSYRTHATLLASQPDQGLRNLGVSLVTAPAIDFNAYSTIALSSPVLQEAEAALGGGGLADVRFSVRTDDMRISSLITITAEGPDPEATAAAANALATALLSWDRGRASRNLNNIVATLESQVGALDAQIEALVFDPDLTEEQYGALLTLRAQQLVELNSARALSTSAIGLLEIVEPAFVPVTPVSRRPVRSAGIAFVLGLFLSYGLLLLRDSLDMRVKSSDDLATATNLPVMAEFPKHKQPSGTYRLSREATSHLRTDVHHATADARPKIILVTSAAAGEGKTSVALSLATSFAINQIRTLLVEADMRRPVLGRVLNLSPIHHHPLQRHLENPFETEGRYTPASVAVNATDKLDVVPTFEPTASPAELLSYGFSACLKKWGEAYDVIIIDSPPVLPVADALTIAPLCTGAILVASMKRSDRRQVQTALSLLQRHGVRVLGTVANRVSAPPRGEAYGYAYEVNEPYPAPLPKLKDKEAGKLQG